MNNSDCFNYDVPNEFISSSWKKHGLPKRPKINVSYEYDDVGGKLNTRIFLLSAVPFHHMHITWNSELYKALEDAAYEHAMKKEQNNLHPVMSDLIDGFFKPIYK